MKTSHIIQTLSTLLDSNISTFLWGTSTINKAFIVEQIATDKKLKLVEINASLLNPSAVWTLPPLPTDTQGILFFDNLDCAPSDIQAFAYTLISQKKVGDYVLPDGWNIVASGNTDEIASSLANHFIHLEVEVEIRDWKNWAFTYGIDERIIAYISAKNEDLFCADIKDKSFTSPASWTTTSKVLRSGIDESLLLEVISGTIGKEKAALFLSFCEGAYQLPDIESILQKGEAEYPVEKNVLYILSSILVSFLLSHKDEESLKNVLKYSAKLEPEFSRMIVEDLQGCGVHLQDLDASL